MFTDVSELSISYINIILLHPPFSGKFRYTSMLSLLIGFYNLVINSVYKLKCHFIVLSV